MTTIIIEPGTPIPDRYSTAEVEEFSFAAVPVGVALPCPACLKFADKHTWQVTVHGRVVACSEAVSADA